MPLLKKSHGLREKHHVWAELVFPARMYKTRQSIFPLSAELTQKDPTFRAEVVRIKRDLYQQHIEIKKANELYFAAIDAAIRRRRGKTA